MSQYLFLFFFSIQLLTFMFFPVSVQFNSIQFYSSYSTEQYRAQTVWKVVIILPFPFNFSFVSIEQHLRVQTILNLEFRNFRSMVREYCRVWSMVSLLNTFLMKSCNHCSSEQHLWEADGEELCSGQWRHDQWDWDHPPEHVWTLQVW